MLKVRALLSLLQHVGELHVHHHVIDTVVNMYTCNQELSSFVSIVDSFRISLCCPSLTAFTGEIM